MTRAARGGAAGLLAVAAAVSGIAFSGAWRGQVTGQEKVTPASVNLQLEPTPLQADPGPMVVVGAEAGKDGGTHYFWADFTVGGDSSKWRLYFDRKDNENYHFLDRAGTQLSLGLREGGVEQSLVQATLPAGVPGAIRVARHGSLCGLFVANHLLASAFDDRLLGGTVGLRNQDEGAVLTIDAKARDEIHFTDDFMREDNTSSVWAKVRCGEGRCDFYIKSLRHPLLSANAFACMGAGQGAMYVSGHDWWSNYRFQSAIRGPENARIGLVIAYQDELNYGLFRWTARPVHADGTPSGPGQRELVRVRNGQEEVVAQAAGGYLPNQWYKTDLLVTHARVQVNIDGHTLIEASDPFLAAGGVGLWCDVRLPEQVAADPKAAPFAINSLWDLMSQHAAFDDIKVSTVSSFEDDFRHSGALARGWLVGTGSWHVETAQDGRPGDLVVDPGSWSTKSLIGNRSWSQYNLQASVQPGLGQAGLVFLYRDESNHFIARTDGRQLELVRVANGQVQSLDRAKLKEAAARDGFIPLNATIKDDHIRVTAADGTTVEGFETQDVLRGRAGLWAAPGDGSGTQPVRFRGFRLTFLEPAQNLVTTNAIFEDEYTMQAWTSSQEEWMRPARPLIVDGRPVNLYWHSNQFPGDVELVIEPREILEEEHEAALSVGKDGSGRNNGYVFRYRAGMTTAEGKKGTVLSLVRQGETVSERILADGEVRELSTLSLRHAGSFLIGKINGKPYLTWRDPQPLEGSKVAYYTKGLLAKIEASKIISERFHDEFFSSAPTSWRTAGYAIAEVANRWQCDPRWSFFSLKNDRAKGKPAVLWSKKLYDGDVTAEFFVGCKMEGERGRPYTYARDINLTICSDGQDLTKGYTFMFGGQENQATMILRNGVEVKRENVTIPTSMKIHRHWFYIRVEKRGDKLSYRVDKYFNNMPQGALEYEDPNPLTGKHIAIWTYDNAVMLSRIRISGQGGTEMEDPDQELAPLKTIYDQ